MKNNLFFYTTTEIITNPENKEEQIEKEFTHAFNLKKVIRAVSLENDELLILLDDIHERITEKPKIDPKTDRIVGTISKTEVFQTEIILKGKERDNFLALNNN